MAVAQPKYPPPLTCCGGMWAHRAACPKASTTQQPLIEWWRPRGSDVSHAFPTSGTLSNWFRSRCRRARYTAGVEAETADTVRCSECELLVAPIPETEARALWGDR